jgi:glycosyltransferase involved in cell wall biosynthesis
MRIVHVTTYSSVGGASKAAYRIHSKLLEKGIESDMLVLKKTGQSLLRVTEIENNFIYRLKDYFFLRLDKILFQRHLRKDATPFSFNFLPRVSIQNHPLLKQADIVCLYWVGADFLTPYQIAKINKPLVWRFSDKWALTGNCHISGGCIRYENHCGRCPQLTTSKEKDFTYYALKRKNNAWKNKDMTIVAPSSWMEDAVKRSTIFKNKTTIRIPTGVDDTIFFPADKVKARDVLNIDHDKTVILFGANNPFDTSYKGGKFFIELINKFSKEKYLFLVFGAQRTGSVKSPDNVRFLGELKKEEDLAQAYNAANIFVSPSTEDNLPNTVLESMSCGTPCIAFQGSGGVIDVIDHKGNGYLAEFKDLGDLINGINWIVEANGTGLISANAREKILQEFTLEKQVNRFINLYRSILKAEKVPH